MPAPYDVDPPTGTTNMSQGMADAVFYAWQGILADAGIAADLCDILACGIRDAVLELQAADALAGLRDQFAMAALQALGSDETFAFSRTPIVLEQSIKTAYAIADQMLVERSL